MIETFEQTINRITQDSSILFTKGEEATKQSIILPILSHLQWNIHDINEVEPEYRVGEGRVDYCLKAHHKKVFIEAKRMREDLESHEKQLLEYSFQEGVEIAVLTNGILWLFYLPTEKGHWQQRKFFTIDFNQQGQATIIKHFNEFLNKSGIIDGSCINSARAIKQSKEKEKAIRKVIPEAWQKLLSGPDETIIEIFADKVESICGHRPEPELLSDFIQEALTKPEFYKKHTQTQVIPAPKKITRKTSVTLHSSEIIKIKLDEKFFEAPSISKLYDDILRYLCDTGIINRMTIPFETSSKRYLIAKEPYHQRGNEFRIPIEYHGYYMEAHKDHKNGLNHLSNFLKSNGIDSQIINYGS